MPRHPRVHAEGLLYHVIARGNNGQRIFLRQDDYEAFLEALRVVRERYPFYLYAYVLMSNHFHLLLEVQRSSTARILQSLLTGYVRRFNRIHHHKGHLFQGRYKAILCDQDSYLLELVRYIHLNPVRAGLVKRPIEWPWSGHGEYLGKQKRGLIDPGPVMEELRNAARYEEFLREKVKESYRAEWHPGDQAPFLGPEKFVKRMAKEKMVPPAARRIPLVELAKKLAVQAGLAPKTLRRKGRMARIVELRDRFIREAVFEQGHLACEVAGFLGCHPSNVSRALQKSDDKS
jgi:REP element-mobilizing transposase RayT